MATLVQVGKAEIQIGGTIVVTMPSATTTHNTLGIIIRTITTGSVTSINDGSNSFTPVGSSTSQDPSMFSYYAKDIIGTATPITITILTGGAFSWAYVMEFSGCDQTAPLGGHDENVGAGGTTDLTSNALTTSTSGALMLGVSQNIFTTYTAGTSYTLSDGSIGTGPYGGVEYRITSVGLSSEVQHITSGSTNQYTLVLLAFKDSGGTNPIGPFPTFRPDLL